MEFQTFFLNSDLFRVFVVTNLLFLLFMLQKSCSVIYMYFYSAYQKEVKLASGKLVRYHDIIEYRDINLETILISDGFGFNRNIDISRYID